MAWAKARKQLTPAQGCSAGGQFSGENVDRQTANAHAQGCGQRAARPCPGISAAWAARKRKGKACNGTSWPSQPA
eukprot:14542354-Alexandrium_andersonii.AAC.1